MQKNIYNAGEEIPENLDYAYIMARDGYYIRKRTALFDAIVKVSELPEMEKQEPCVRMLAPKIPYALIQEAHAFFRAVFDRMRGEAVVFLLFEQGEWLIHVPRQEVSGSGIDYENDLHKQGKRPAGTIHSHCNMGAFFSTTDDGDDREFDGVHITLGRIESNVPEIAVSVAVNGHRFRFDPEEIITDLPSACADHPWLEKVSERKRELEESFFDKKKKPADKRGKALDGMSIVDKVDLYAKLQKDLDEASENDPMVQLYLDSKTEGDGTIKTS